MNNGRKVAEGGVLLAIYCILFLMTLYLPLLGGIVFFFVPIPFILFAVKQELSWCFGFLFIACVLSVILGSLFSVILPLTAGLVGLTVGHFLKQGRSMLSMYITSVLVFLGSLIVMLAGSSVIFGVNFIQEFTSVMKKSFDQSSSMIQGMGLEGSEAQLAQLKELPELINTLLPTMLVISSMGIVFLMILAAQPFIKRFSSRMVEWPPFRNLRLPKSILWYYLITMLFSLFITEESSHFGYSAVLNLLYILQFFIIIQGYSFVFFFAHVKGWAKPVPYIILAVTLLIPFFSFFIRLLGIIDLGFPFRERIKGEK
ncbi:YybS family protein [Bacillus massiliglaciei]|uniref:YybS family protein n=1 Tax=Bacillus massiliglaciei TaxID=1816693 RepID=UPI000AB55A58|nr:YybS family protein [Bacillus massiliglaciei]